MKDPLFFNKLAAAVLTAALLFFGLPQVAGALFGGGHHGGHHGELKLAYPIEYEVAPAGGGGGKVEEDMGTMMASVEMPAASRRVAICKSCHTFEEGGANGTGPNLWDIVGKDVASKPGFNYSSALKEFGGKWTYERLDKYIENSQAYVPGTAMVQRFGKSSQRAEVLVFLSSLSANPVPFPEPAAKADHSDDESHEGDSH